MVASVLGKRQRCTDTAEESATPIRSSKRRTRNAPPEIYNDEADSSRADSLEDGSSFMEVDDLQPSQRNSIRVSKSRTVTSKRAIQNIRPKVVKSPATAAAVDPELPNDENVPPLEFKTPSATRFRDALSSTAPATPKHRVRLIGKPLTPRTPRTLPTPTSKALTAYATARSLFAQSTSPSKLIGRDTERHQLRYFINEAVRSKRGGCMYVSGPPGTGKSALLEEIFAEFSKVDSVTVANVNCVGIRSAKQVYGKLVSDFGLDRAIPARSEKDKLCNAFLPKTKAEGKSYLVLLDEIDSLLDGDCEVLYSLFDWALHKSSCLILIGIANALDLTDRFLPRLKARNLKPRLLPFLPYNAGQIASIITEKLKSTLTAVTNASTDYVPFVHPAAIQLTSKKVASQSGDMRKAFSLIRRAIDQMEQETLQKSQSTLSFGPTKQPLTEISNMSSSVPPTPPESSPLKPAPTENVAAHLSLHAWTPETAPRATVAHVARLASSIFNNGTHSRLAHLNLQQKAILCSLVAIEKHKVARDPFSTPSKSANKALAIKDLYTKYALLCTRDDGILQPLKNTEFRDVVASLETLGLVHESVGRTTNLITPTKTPSRVGRNSDERQIVSAVSEKEMTDNLKGAGADVLQRLMYSV